RWSCPQPEWRACRSLRKPDSVPTARAAAETADAVAVVAIADRGLDRRAGVVDALSLILHDTIVAISTPPGRGGIGVVRLSGPDSVSILRTLVCLGVTPTLEPWKAALGELVDDAGHTIDRVVVTYFARPRSYTAEDVVEI